MRANEAVSRINAIHSMLNRTVIFRGYRSRTTLFSAVLAVVAALVQTNFIPEPQENLVQYFCLWGGVAALSLVCSAWHLWKSYKSHSGPFEKAKYHSALTQLLPGIAAGAGLTIVLCGFAMESIWMLPGLWSICFGLAVCSSAAILPKTTLIGGVYFILAGLVVLAFSGSDVILAPWLMIVTFAAGQTLNALLLYWSLERRELNQREPINE